MDFLFEYIFVRFGVPRETFTSQGAQLISKLVQSITHKYKIKHRTYTPYHPWADGQVESTNKILEGILTKTMQLHKKDWEDRIP